MPRGISPSQLAPVPSQSPSQVAEAYQREVARGLRDCPEGKHRGGSVGAGDVFRLKFTRLYFLTILADAALDASYSIGNGPAVLVPANTSIGIGRLELETLAPGILQIGATTRSFAVIFEG